MDFNSKAEQINLVLSEPDVDLWKLRELALTEGGLVNGEFISLQDTTTTTTTVR
jgi:hypothetical protein